MSEAVNLVRPARPGRARLLRRLRRPLRARDARRADRGARSASISKARKDPAFAAELTRLLAHYVGRPTPLWDARRLRRGRWRRTHLPEARGSHAHRRAQDQQRARAGAARQAHGQDPHRRRDRRRAARRRERHRVRAARARVRRLHGHRGHAAPGAQRVPHAPARRHGRRRRFRQPHAEGRDQRSDARLGRAPARHALPARLRARAASVSADGPRVPVGDRHAKRDGRSSSRPAGCPTP